MRHSKADREQRVLHTQDRSKWVHTSAKHRYEVTPGHPGRPTALGQHTGESRGGREEEKRQAARAAHPPRR